MTIAPLYKAILASMGCTVDNEGLVSMDISGLVVPVTVDGARLAVPTPERLRFGDWSGTVAFHPLSENLVRGESPVLRVFKNLMVIRLHTVIHELLHQLTTLGFETHRHSSLSPKAQEFLSALPDVDKKSVEAMLEIIEAAAPDSHSNRIVTMFVKRNGQYRGNRYSRVAVVSFPLLEQFEQANNGTVVGVKLRRKDFHNFQNLIQYIFPDALDMDKYSAPSSSMVAPNFDALLQAFLKLARRLNYVVETHREHLEDADSLLIDTSWEDQVGDLSSFNGQIPSLSGNEGDLLEPENLTKPITATPVTPYVKSEPAPAPAVPSLPTPAPKSPFNTDLGRLNDQRPAAPVVSQPPPRKANGLDFNAAMEARHRAMVGHQMPPQTPPGYPAAPYGHPAPAPMGYGAPMGYPAPAQTPIRYERGIPVYGPPAGVIPGLPPGMHPSQLPAWATTNDSRIGIGYAGNAPAPAPVYGQPAWGGGFPNQGYGGNSAV